MGSLDHEPGLATALDHDGEEPPETDDDELARVRRSEQRYRAMVHASRDALLVADLDSGRFVDANPAACRMFGYSVSEFRKLTGRTLTAPEEHETMVALSHDINHRGQAHAPRLKVLRKDGSRFWVALRTVGYVLDGQKLYLVSLRDISHQVNREAELADSNERLRTAQERLLRSERLAALGQLSATVAHEINNPLQYVDLGLAELHRALRDRGLPPELLQMFDQVRDGVDRITSLTRDLASFARIESSKVEAVNLDGIVERACRMANTEIRHRARLELDLATRSRLPADRGKLAQLVTNLVVNAAHAIVEGHADVNRITVRTRERGGVLSLVVEDTGRGIPPDIVGRIFEPFFTTKPAGQGGGLGLAVCAEIVRLHRGTIDVDSEPGQGSRFRIELPLDNGLRPPDAPKEGAAPSRRGRVLVIDDDALVLRGLQRLISKKHEVVAAAGGDEGIRILADDEDFDVILCDLMMPVIDGIAVHEEVQRRDPRLAERMVFCSGGAFTPRAQQFVATIRNPMLRKPMGRGELFEAIAAVMARAR